MDLTTLALVIAAAAAAFGLDAYWYPRDAVLEVRTAGRIETTTLDAALARAIVQDQVARVSATRTLLATPRIRPESEGGMAVAVAEAIRLQSVTQAMQAQFGNRPDEFSVVLFSEDSQIKALVSGRSGRDGTAFSQVLVQNQGESVVDLLRRAALVDMTHLDPYLTALYLLQTRAVGGDIAPAQNVIGYVLPRLPATPVSVERSRYENLLGILAVLRHDMAAAEAAFSKAVNSDPDNAAAAVNLAFADLQLVHYDDAALRMRELVQTPPDNRLLLSTAYVTWAAARLGLRDIDGAETLLTDAAASADNAAVSSLWADLRELKGDAAGAERLRLKAGQSTVAVENYAEVATLYFRLAWKDNQPLITTPYRTTDAVALN